MNILGIAGSPRDHGLSTKLLGSFMDEVESSANRKTINLSSLEIISCTGCDACLKGDCPLDEKDDFPVLREAMLDADVIVLASPNYFLNVPGIVKDLIDRSRRLKMDKYRLKDKVFAAIVASGLRNGGGEITVMALHSWALSQGMVLATALGHPVIENQFAIGTLQKDGLKAFRGKDEQDEIALASIKDLAKRALCLAEKLAN